MSITSGSIADITSMDQYLRAFGHTLGKKAADSLRPLHIPGVTPLLDFSDTTAFNPARDPFPCQQHVITAATKMLDSEGGGFIVGEMGTGKTIIAILAYHKHARGKPYRTLVLCPDHLILKWKREIESTIPGARVRHFDSWREVLTLLDKRSKGKGKNGKAKWQEPVGPEWYILGRNQAKWTPRSAGMPTKMPGFGGHYCGGLSSSTKIVAHEPMYDERGRAVYNPKTGHIRRKPVTAKFYLCPRCGHPIRDKEGNPIGDKEINKKQLFCEATYLQEITPKDKPQDGKKQHNYERIYSRTDALISSRYADWKDGKEIKIEGRSFVVKTCGEALWQWTNSPYRWPPAKIIKNKCRGFFKYMVVDEVHEQKGDDSAQADACGALIGAVDYVLALTGTIIGGYAHNLFALMVRMGFKSLFDEGHEWKKYLPFAEDYGRVDKIVSTKFKGGSIESYASHGAMSMRKDTIRPNTTTRIAPGIMPPLFGNHMLGRSIFLTLEEMAEQLPPLVEYVGGPRDVDFGDESYNKLYAENWFPCAVSMDDEQKLNYTFVEGTLEKAMRDLLVKGSLKLLSTFLYATLDYPDRPYGWAHLPEVRYAIDEAVKAGATIDPAMVGTLGYWEKKSGVLNDWIGVVTPPEMDRATVYPKEQQLIDICKHHKAQGNQCWVFLQMTRKRDIQPRLQGLLEKEGLRVCVFRSEDSKLKNREDWIRRNGKDYDVIISFPKLVSTGLDLFGLDAGASHNFNTLIFYETGYNLFDLRQASRRSWRIGQPKNCFVYYLYYKGKTMQARAMQLMSRKMAAAMALDGEFSSEGLAGMAGEDNGQMAMVKSLSESLDENDMQRNWGKVKGGVVRRPGTTWNKATTELFDGSHIPPPGEPSPFDGLSMAGQMIAETICEHEVSPSELYDDIIAAEEAIAAVEARDRADLAAMLKELEAMGMNFDDL